MPSTMALGNIANQLGEINIDQGEPDQRVQADKPPEYLLGKLSHEVFKHDCLDRTLKQHHVTGNCTPDRHRDLLAYLGQGLHSPPRLALVSFRLQGRS